MKYCAKALLGSPSGNIWSNSCSAIGCSFRQALWFHCMPGVGLLPGPASTPPDRSSQQRTYGRCIVDETVKSHCRNGADLNNQAHHAGWTGGMGATSVLKGIVEDKQ